MTVDRSSEILTTEQSPTALVPELEHRPGRWIANWDAEKEGIEAELKRRNLTYRGSAKTSFQVKDPEGLGVQFGGLHQ